MHRTTGHTPGHTPGRTLGRTLVLALGFAALAACGDYGDDDYAVDPPPPPPPPGPVATVLSATGDVGPRVNEFRTLLGDPSNGGTAGEQATGRREIGWDGAAANPFNNRDDFPAGFFNSTVKSGVIFTTPGTGFRNDSTLFKELNTTYGEEFRAFSPTKIFTPIGSNVMDVLFQVAGEPAPARVTGFGVVFSDVDVADRTTIELFDVNGASLAKVAAPIRSDSVGLSFVGAKFADPIVARARITLGSGALGATVNDVSGGGTADLVVTDNFVYGEPKRIP
jgi:hypothetical protein